MFFQYHMTFPFSFASSYDLKKAYKHAWLVMVTNKFVFRASQSQTPKSQKHIFWSTKIHTLETLLEGVSKLKITISSRLSLRNYFEESNELSVFFCEYMWSLESLRTCMIGSVDYQKIFRPLKHKQPSHKNAFFWSTKILIKFQTKINCICGFNYREKIFESL